MRPRRLPRVLGVSFVAVVLLSMGAHPPLPPRESAEGPGDLDSVLPNLYHVKAPPRTVAETKTWLALQKVVPMNFPDETPLKDIVKFIRESNPRRQLRLPQGHPNLCGPPGVAGRGHDDGRTGHDRPRRDATGKDAPAGDPAARSGCGHRQGWVAGHHVERVQRWRARARRLCQLAVSRYAPPGDRGPSGGRPRTPSREVRSADAGPGECTPWQYRARRRISLSRQEPRVDARSRTEEKSFAWQIMNRRSLTSDSSSRHPLDPRALEPRR